MDENLLKDRVRLGAVAFFLLGLFVLAVGFGLFFFHGQSSSSNDVKILSASSSSAPVSSEILVDVGGAVVSPGLYHLKIDSRVDDAVAAAGGFSTNADKAKVNLAAKIVDGQKIYIQSQNSKAVSQNGGSEVSSLISINSASEIELDSLPGVGPATASKIISNRPYSSLEELKSKKAVTGATYDKVKDLITL